MHIKNLITKAINLDSIEILEQECLPIKNKIQNTMKIEWNYNNVKTLYLENLGAITRREFLVNPDNINKLDTIIYYLIRDDKFLKSPLLKMTDQSVPSFDKGLLLVGGVGTGKSSFLEAMSMTQESIPFLRTTYHVASDLVTEYEGSSDLKEFNKKFCNGRRIFDDMLREKIASNFGKTNLMKEIMASRYVNKKLTYASINYANQFPGDIDNAMEQIGDKYEDYIYDRFFDMCNIVEFPGKSMRR